MDNNNDSNNLTFFIDEDNETNINEESIQKMLFEFNNDDDDDNNNNNFLNFEENFNLNNEQLSYYLKKTQFKDFMELYYEEYKIKDLLKICEYYKIDKFIKNLKCKKQDIISSIIFFEGQPENQSIVENRHRMWAYMEELLKDACMRKYLIWN